MQVDDRNTSRDASFVRETIALLVPSVAANQADVLRQAFKPGFPFEIVDVQHFVDGIAATASYMVKIGTTNALNAAAVPVADTRGDAALHASRGNRRGGKDDEINLHVTTDGTGSMTDLRVFVTIRSSQLRF